MFEELRIGLERKAGIAMGNDALEPVVNFWMPVAEDACLSGVFVNPNASAALAVSSLRTRQEYRKNRAILTVIKRSAQQPLAQLRQLPAEDFFNRGGIGVACKRRGVAIANHDVVKTKLVPTAW